MPVSDQANQMSMLQQMMQQMQAQAQLAPLMQKLMQAQQAPPPAPVAQSPTGQGQGLSALLGGGAGAPLGQLQQNQQPPTLGVNQPIPMQMPPADQTGQQQQPPLPPNPTDMSGGLS